MGNVNVSQLELFAVNVQSMIVNHLMTYPLGKIQFKLSWNNDSHTYLSTKLRSCIEGLNEFMRVNISDRGTLKYLSEECSYSDINFKQYAMSATKKNDGDIKNTDLVE